MTFEILMQQNAPAWEIESKPGQSLATVRVPVVQQDYFVYIMSNVSKTVYIGVTNDLERRVYEHRMKRNNNFTRRYNITKLVYVETHPAILQAIEREKQLKGLLRSKKLALIREANPEFRDLAHDWYS
jgi:putative endonuclease